VRNGGCGSCQFGHSVGMSNPKKNTLEGFRSTHNHHKDVQSNACPLAEKLMPLASGKGRCGLEGFALVLCAERGSAGSR
jgi:hypothetical protein